MANSRKWAKDRPTKPPDGRIRQSQVVSTFGPGSMLDLLDDAVLVGGLDFWRLKGRGDVVNEPRLLEIVEPLYLRNKWPLSKEAPFRKPPAGDEREPSENCGIQVYEFPRWFVCQNPRCRALVRASSLERVNQEYRHRCSGVEARPERCVPVRFVAACRRGHLADIDWSWWMHEKTPCDAPQLRLEEGVTGDFSDIEVACTTCNRRRRLIEMTQEERQDRCGGERPWLGLEREPCEERQRLLVRTASNGYFAQTTSAITIPEPESLRRKVQAAWNVLQAATAETLPAFRTIPNVQEALGNASNEEVLAAITAERGRKPEAVPEIRTAEWLQFLSQPVEKPGEMPKDRSELFWARRIARPPALPPPIQHVVLARRLREVQAQVGFTRLEPLSKDLQGRYDLEVELARMSLNRDWVPVTEMQGEGVLLVLDEEQVHAWEQSPPVLRRAEVLYKAWERWKKHSKSKLPFPGVRLYLLHSLAHLLMTEVALECGYPASSIRERLYCAPHDEAVPMAGILLMTGTTGAEGTLGGLVEEGRRLGRHLGRAWEDARLCSNDPVCAHHEPMGRDDRNLEGAACHSCLFVPECSCERFNQYLDRALVVPTLGHEDVAFLKTPWT
ncbi:DUF1998 domain-containing protein [Corallococcus sp. CA053C]|uniref:DUF1998 domain-containing protein n=1 Tax=Corallococcus sp. CA053C TaxID=2316732 RepID=UPI000EA36AE4|nr:DUF1998 domain-containing protein [Corallococcus sp. CA053C]RKH12632.1 DUF1998 domain-containing protein [Corallococcus sp. CA053C]